MDLSVESSRFTTIQYNTLSSVNFGFVTFVIIPFWQFLYLWNLKSNFLFSPEQTENGPAGGMG